MKCPRLFISPAEISGDRVSFSEKDARYLYKVLRLRVGDRAEICTGTQDFLVELTTCKHDAVRGRVIKSCSITKSQGIEIILGFSTVRPGPVEEILRHGTELGIARFIPILSRRTNRRPFEKKQRWETVVASAAAQSGRSILPEIEVPVAFEQFIQQECQEELRLLLSAGPESAPILKVLDEHSSRKVIILAGPEGGLDVSEIKQAIDVGFEPVSLGSRVLRSETAAVVAAGTVGLWYDWLNFRCIHPDE